MSFSHLRDKLRAQMQELKIEVRELKNENHCKINKNFHFVYVLGCFKTIKQLLHAFITRMLIVNNSNTIFSQAFLGFVSFLSSVFFLKQTTPA